MEDKDLFNHERQELNSKVEFNKDWRFKKSFPKITCYCTTYNCEKGKYPYLDAIKSWLQIADELVVVDGGSEDSTREKLQEFAEKHNRIKVYDIPIDLEMPGKDGHQKSLSRAMGSSPFLIQFDVDEFLVGDPEQWKQLCKDMPADVDILSLPVLEPYGNSTDLRLNKSHNPTKWRVTRNKPEITHGIPKHDRKEREGKIYSKGGSDGCFPIHLLTEEMYPSKNHKTAQRMFTLFNQNPEQYKKFIQEQLAKGTPMVYHAGHIDLQNKISHYLTSWHGWWCQLFDKDPTAPENNLFFPGTLPSDVTPDMIHARAQSLKIEIPTVSVDELHKLYHHQLMSDNVP